MWWVTFYDTVSCQLFYLLFLYKLCEYKLTKQSANDLFINNYKFNSVRQSLAFPFRQFLTNRLFFST